MKFVYVMSVVWLSVSLIAEHPPSKQAEAIAPATTPSPSAPKPVNKEVKTPAPAIKTEAQIKAQKVQEPTKETLSTAKPTPTPKKIEEDTAKKAQEAKELSLLADAIQKQYNRTQSATFDFEQRYSSAFISQNELAKGKVWYKARNMLWRYEEPKDRQKEFYIEGKKFTYHIVNDKLAFTHDCFEKDTLSASISFLWGQGKLKESFIIQPYEGTTAGSPLKWLTLIPKEKNAPVKSISLGVDAKTAIVQESIVTDLSGGKNSFRFSKFVTNPAIPEKTFHFVPPQGLKVQPMPNVVCPKTPAPVKTPPTPPAKIPPKASPTPP